MLALPFAHLLPVLFSLKLGILYSTVGAYTQLHKHCLLQEPKSKEDRMHTSLVSFRISIPVGGVSVYCGRNQVKRTRMEKAGLPSRQSHFLQPGCRKALTSTAV